MLLSTSLYSMMYSCECLFLINTQNSINYNDVINRNGITNSPWLLAELSIVDIICRKDIKSHRAKLTISEESRHYDNLEPFQVNYLPPMDQLKKISIDDLRQWQNKSLITHSFLSFRDIRLQKTHPLDEFYNLVDFEIGENNFS